MKVMTILGTRPEIIRLSRIVSQLDMYADQHVLVHTGQNYVRALSDVFFEEMKLTRPQYTLSHRRHSLGGQLSAIFGELERIMVRERPDKVLVLGDTNSALSVILAERMGIPSYHMEAGNRCYDLTVPEEKNRRVVDAVSSFNLPYTERGKMNLLREGYPVERIMVSGNPIYEVLQHYESEISGSRVMKRLGLRAKEYMLATVHRAENVDRPERLSEIVGGLCAIARSYGQRILCSLHPKTRARLKQIPSLRLHPLVELYEPFGFFDFVRLEQNALCVLTDSGTVQEECCLFRVPTVTMRTSTERQETVDCGSNMLSGLNASRILAAVNVMLSLPASWAFPEGYTDRDVSSKVVKFILGGNEDVR